MKRSLLASAAVPALLAYADPAWAQAPCGGVNFTPTLGANCLLEPGTPSYAATAVALAPGASATDVMCLTGSATKTVKLQQIRISGSATTTVQIPVLITKHASANTGGTAATSSALPVPYALDSTNPTVSATTQAWTGPPTIADSTPGYIDSGNVSFALVAATGAGSVLAFDYLGRNYMQAPTLRGIAQQVCINFGTTTVTSGNVNLHMKWTEF